MPDRNVPIFELDKKVIAMQEVLFKMGKIDRPSRSELARFSELKTKTLNSAIYAGGATKSVQEKLATVCKFSIESKYWIDPDLTDIERRHPKDPYRGEDTSENFHRYLRQSNGLDSHLPTRLYGDRPEINAPELASFALTDFGQAAPPEEGVLVFLELDFTPGCDEMGYEYGFSRVRVIPNFPNEKRVEIKKRLGNHDPIEINNAALEGKGTEHHPYWELTAKSEKQVLEGDYSTKDDPLFELKSTDVPYQFSADLRVRLHDGTLRAKGEKPLPSRNKRVIIQRLMGLMLEADLGGWQALGSQVLRIRKMDR